MFKKKIITKTRNIESTKEYHFRVFGLSCFRDIISFNSDFLANKSLFFIFKKVSKQEIRIYR